MLVRLGFFLFFLPPLQFPILDGTMSLKPHSYSAPKIT